MICAATTAAAGAEPPAVQMSCIATVRHYIAAEPATAATGTAAEQAAAAVEQPRQLRIRKVCGCQRGMHAVLATGGAARILTIAVAIIIISLEIIFRHY